jgi:hypothetical protein
MDTGRPTVLPLMRILDAIVRKVRAEAGVPYQPEEAPGVSVTFTLNVQIVG